MWCGEPAGDAGQKEGGTDRNLKQRAGAKITGLGITPNHKGLAPNSLTTQSTCGLSENMQA